MREAPQGKEPYEVARWLLARKDKSSNGDLFTSVWAVASNPVIPWMFRFTDESPCNDLQLDWCAAFVSWALAQSSRTRLPYADVAGDAAALRCAAHSSIDDFKEGDVVLLKREKGGHVAFFAGWGREKGRTIRLLGGNQAGGRVIDSEYDLATNSDKVLGKKLRLDFGVPGSAFKAVSYGICTPSVVDGCDHLVAAGCDPGAWPKCA